MPHKTPQPPATISVTEYARRRGVSRQAVNLAIREGRIRREDDGKIDPVAADADWDRSTDPSKPRSTAAGRRESAAAPEDLDDDEKVPFSVSRARREHLRAEIEALNLKVRRGELVAVADVVKQWEDRLVHARAKAYAAVDSFGPAIVSASSMEEARAVGLALLEEFLGSVSQPVEDEDAKPAKSAKAAKPKAPKAKGGKAKAKKRSSRSAA